MNLKFTVKKINTKNKASTQILKILRRFHGLKVLNIVFSSKRNIKL